MTPARWRELEALYHAAQGLSPAEQDRLLEHADPELRAVVGQDSGSRKRLRRKPPHFWIVPPGKTMKVCSRRKATSRIGTQLGPYRIEEQIGRGGMGDVFRATDTRLQRTVAIKTSLVQFTERFQREARAIAALNHPHIATLYDVGSSPEGLGYLVLEYVEGPTLAELIDKGPWRRRRFSASL